MIGIDVDDVVVATNGDLMRLPWENLGRADEFVPAVDWGLPNWPVDVRSEYYRLLNTDALFSAGLCDARIPKVLRNLKSNFIFVTSRTSAQYTKTIEQLQRLGILFNPARQLFCVGDSTTYGSKIDVLKQNNAQLMIDDAAHNVLDCLDSDIPAVMISNDVTTWNHSARATLPHRPGLVNVLMEYGLVKRMR